MNLRSLIKIIYFQFKRLMGYNMKDKVDLIKQMDIKDKRKHENRYKTK